jgi:internalin A
VDDLCAAAEAQGCLILRDKNVLSLGDSISSFMRRIGEGDRVFVILSDKYLRSSFCMYELNEIWRTCRHEEQRFRDRIRVYTLPDADIWKPIARVRHAGHWRREFEALEAAVSEEGVGALGDRDHAAFRQMREFYAHTSDILAALADLVQPRTFEELKQHGFA